LDALSFSEPGGYGGGGNEWTVEDLLAGDTSREEAAAEDEAAEEATEGSDEGLPARSEELDAAEKAASSTLRLLVYQANHRANSVCHLGSVFFPPCPQTLHGDVYLDLTSRYDSNRYSHPHPCI
jgi:hypothetical protein